MLSRIEKLRESTFTANGVVQKIPATGICFYLLDNRPKSVVQKKRIEAMSGSGPLQLKNNNMGLPNQLKSGIENLSGISMDDVKVHHNSDKPAQLNALAYAQGTDIHIASGQEKHLPHEAWHVVQQKQGRVKPTMQMKGTAINDNRGLEKEADLMGIKALQMKGSSRAFNDLMAPKMSGASCFVQMYHPDEVPYKSEEELMEKGDQLYRQRNALIDRGDVSGVFLLDGHIEEILDIARQNGWMRAFEQIVDQTEYLFFTRDEKKEKRLIEKAIDLGKRYKTTKSGQTEVLDDIFFEAQVIEKEAGKKEWNHIIRLIRKVIDLPPYKAVIFGNPSGASTYGIDSPILDETILAERPNPDEALGFLKDLDDILEKVPTGGKVAEAEKVKLIRRVIFLNIKMTDDDQIKMIKAFINTWKVGVRKDFKPTVFIKMLTGVVTTGLQRRTESPLITVTGPQMEPQHHHRLDVGIHMTTLENKYDIIARKSSAPGGGGIPGAVHEVDLAFLRGMRGIPSARATLKPGKPEIGGDDGGGEKVYAIGHAAALNFGGELSNIGQERFYGVMYPKGFLNRYGLDLKTAGITGKSASTPIDTDFSRGYMHDNQDEKNPRINIPSDKAFAIRAEKATPKGQVHIHFARSNMVIHSKPMSQLDFLRTNAIGIVEYNSTGFIINIKYF